MHSDTTSRTTKAYDTQKASGDKPSHSRGTRWAQARTLVSQVYGSRRRRRPTAGEVFLDLAELGLAS